LEAWIAWEEEEGDLDTIEEAMEAKRLRMAALKAKLDPKP